MLLRLPRLSKYLKLFGLLTILLVSVIVFIHLYILSRPSYPTENDPQQQPIEVATNSLHEHHTEEEDITTLEVTTYVNELTKIRRLIDQGDSWPKDSFCDEFISHKFKVDVSFCKDDPRRIECYGSPYIKMMGTCTFHQVAVDLHNPTITKTPRPSIDDLSLWLVREHEGLNPCPHTDFSQIDRYMPRGEWVKKLAKTASLSVPKGKCQSWINGTTFFFIGSDVHIYFKFLSWYSLHAGMANDNNSTKLTIIRLPETLDNNFLFPEFEKLLFPEADVYSIEDFSRTKDGIVCFQKATVVPGAFGSIPFRCKMADAPSNIKSKCFSCNSRGLPGTRIQSFRRRVLNACDLKDSLRTDNEIKTIVVQLRKQYHRFTGDNPSKYSRVLKNPNQLLTALKQSFPSANVLSMHSEDLPICDQITLAHKADVLIGVHGAGLVHLWWLQEHALLFELVPHSQLSNPTFKLLSTLAGKHYHGYSRVGGNEKEVVLNVDQVVSELKQSLEKIKL